MELNGYDLSKAWFDFCFENPEKISTGHTALYFFAIEHCNRLGWKEKFGFPTSMAMEATGIKKHHTFLKYLNDLCDFGFVKMIEKSRNQYSANVISLKSAMPKNGKARGIATAKHRAKHGHSTVHSTGHSNGSIDKHSNIEHINPIIGEVRKFFTDNGYTEHSADRAWNYYNDAGWKDRNGKPVINWKQKMRLVWFKDENKQKEMPKPHIPAEQNEW